MTEPESLLEEPEAPGTRVLLQLLWRGILWRCPHCGEGLIYAWFYQLRDNCTECGFDLAARAKDTWAVIYLTTAGLTGAIIAGMLIVKPFNLVLGQLVLAVFAVVVIVASLPSRKGMAIGFDYYIERNSRTSRSTPNTESGD